MSTLNMYMEHILDHYKNPRNHGKIENPTVSSKGDNPLCGDEIEIFLKINSDGKIEDIKFIGKGCAISQASASLLTQKLKGKNVGCIEEISRDEVVEMLGIELGPVRLKCALLALYALKNCLFIYKEK